MSDPETHKMVIKQRHSSSNELEPEKTSLRISKYLITIKYYVRIYKIAF
jgi:hypothetical protein